MIGFQNFTKMIIKLPRNQVEIVEVIKQTEENVDVDIEGNEDKIMSDFDSKYSSPISSESPNDKNIDQNRQQSPMIIEHWNVNESDDSVEEKPNIDKITLENLNSGPYESKADKEFQYEAEDDDIDNEWRPDNAEESEHDSFEDEYDDNDDEWNPYGKSNSRKSSAVRKKKTPDIQKTNKKQISSKEQNSQKEQKQSEPKSTLVKKEFLCNLCEKSFTMEKLLTRHVVRCHSERLCPICGASFGGVRKLNFHVKKEHGQSLHDCPLCKERFASVEDVHSHTNSAHSVSAYACTTPFCCKVYTSDLYLRTHLKCCGSKKKEILRCEKCNKVFATKFTMEEHLDWHMGVNYTCKDCNATFSHSRTLYRHINMEHWGYKYRCEPCKRDFADDRGLVKHNKIVHKVGGGMPEKYLCTLCPNKYYQKITLLRHIKNDHYGLRKKMKPLRVRIKKQRKQTKKSIKKYWCCHCNKIYFRKCYLRYHLESFHYGFKYFCSLCGKCYSKKKSLERHILGHEKSLFSFPCNHCEKIFIKESLLRAHINECTGMGVIGTQRSSAYYMCSYCYMSFGSKLYLIHHIQGYHYLRVNLCQDIQNTKVEHIKVEFKT